jgi:hypothetical protein
MTNGQTSYLQLNNHVVMEAVEEYLNKRLTKAAQITVSDLVIVEDGELFEFQLTGAEE